MRQKRKRPESVAADQGEMTKQIPRTKYRHVTTVMTSGGDE